MTQGRELPKKFRKFQERSRLIAAIQERREKGAQEIQQHIEETQEELGVRFVDQQSRRRRSIFGSRRRIT